jgi:hypothetical protein
LLNLRSIHGMIQEESAFSKCDKIPSLGRCRSA